VVVVSFRVETPSTDQIGHHPQSAVPIGIIPIRPHHGQVHPGWGDEYRPVCEEERVLVGEEHHTAHQMCGHQLAPPTRINRQRPSAPGTGILDTVPTPLHDGPDLPRSPAVELELLGWD
jgi:hypothetical protein